MAYGSSLKYKVYANRIADKDWITIKFPFKSKEWQYDIHWYTEGNPFMPITIPLVAECEWDYKIKKEKIRANYKYKYTSIPYSAVKYDFQKLLVSNAELRLLIFQISNIDDFEVLEDYFKKAIGLYTHLFPTDKFLFVAYHFRTKSMYFLKWSCGQSKRYLKSQLTGI